MGFLFIDTSCSSACLQTIRLHYYGPLQQLTEATQFVDVHASQKDHTSQFSETYPQGEGYIHEGPE
ncbi:MAG: hypothetical protein A2032_01685 [Chloroflexi bacterium RBG_19FT_COMBO_49_13]|nr:MAG: hypothetical protein A2032_01685 [Chloroflexi bacterium RBG_19FT_COMBO_49_13]